MSMPDWKDFLRSLGPIIGGLVSTSTVGQFVVQGLQLYLEATQVKQIDGRAEKLDDLLSFLKINIEQNSAALNENTIATRENTDALHRLLDLLENEQGISVDDLRAKMPPNTDPPNRAA